MLDEDDESQRITITPPLDRAEVALLGGLAGAGEGPRRVWPGQPGRRSPWLPCADGCCLALESRPPPGRPPAPAVWLRFLIREVLAPRSAAARRRADEVGLLGGHVLTGRVLVGTDGDRPRLVVVGSNRVRELELDDDLFPVERPPRRGPGEVVPLEAGRDDRGKARRAQRADR